MHFTYKYERGNIGVLSMSFYVIFVAVDYRRYYCTRFSSRKSNILYLLYSTASHRLLDPPACVRISSMLLSAPRLSIASFGASSRSPIKAIE